VSRRRRAYRLGLRAEQLAALVLRCKGYRVLARRYRTPAGEIDLIARRGGTIAFVEVKARASMDAAADALTPGSERRIEAAADMWAGRHLAGVDDYVLRFDLMLVAPWRWPRHIENAFSGKGWSSVAQARLQHTGTQSWF